MSIKESLRVDSEKLSEITNIGMKAVKRVNEAIEKKTVDALNINAEHILSRDIQATVNSIKTQILAHRVLRNTTL